LPTSKTAPYGSWKSPIGGEALATGASLPNELTLEGETLYWLELRPSEGGRYALCRWERNGEIQEVIPKEYNVRTRVHEYGGGAYAVQGRTVYFSNFADQLVYRLAPGEAPVPVTKRGLRFADLVADEKRLRMVGVCEDHTSKKQGPVNTIAAFSMEGSKFETLVSGNDFYSSPRIDPSGSRIAWITWNFPEMPWDGSELWVGEISDEGAVVNRKRVAGGTEVSVIMPEWSPEGVLHFISDRSGFWNIYRLEGAKVERVVSLGADMGRPLWAFRFSTYAFESEGRIVCSFTREGRWHIGILHPSTKKIKVVRTPYTEIGSVRAGKGHAYFLGGSSTEPYSVVDLNLATEGVAVLRRPEVSNVDEGYISRPRHIEFTTTGGKKAYGWFYQPANRDFRAPRGERPPLIVISHGGPTSQARTDLSLGIQFWTSRGFAVLDVNYGGSTGYGRKYRERLAGNWGIVDVDDCCNGALALAKEGLVDGKRLIIRGGSAGGYTTLCSLAFRKVFGAGASYYGLSDLELFAKETHKFESRYLDKIVAPYPVGRKIYRERSAIHYPHRISVPVIFFQGLEDAVVPPSQAETMVRSLRERGVPVAYIAFEGEQHGFRKAETIKRASEAELYFYSKVFGFALPWKVKPVEIWNSRSLG
jgi:dipeptidyl aminopeptidase/acylaminoacyl peptidase